MNQEKLKQKQLRLIDGQLIGCLLYIVSLIIATIIVGNTRKKFLQQDRTLTDQEIQQLGIANKIFILLLVLFFLYLSYEGYILARETGQDTRNLSLQVFASFLSVIIALIGLWIVYQGSIKGKITLPEIENPFA